MTLSVIWIPSGPYKFTFPSCKHVIRKSSGMIVNPLVEILTEWMNDPTLIHNIQAEL